MKKMWNAFSDILMVPVGRSKDRIDPRKQGKQEQPEHKKEGKIEYPPDRGTLLLQVHENCTHEADLEGRDKQANFHVPAVTADHLVEVDVGETNREEGKCQKDGSH